MEELKKFLNPLFFVIIIVGFFLPFFNLTCQQQKIASITGFELITGTTISTNGLNKRLIGISVPQNEINNGIKTDTVSPEPLALIAFLLAVGGLIFSLFNKFSDIGSALAGLLGGLSLFYLNSIITDNILGKFHYQPLEVECGAGYYITILLFISLLIYNAYLFFQRIIYKPKKVYSFGGRMRFCPQCGSENDMVSIYCNKCGGRMGENLV
jgi:hypothetical protein